MPDSVVQICVINIKTKKMKAIITTHFGNPEVLEEISLPIPSITDHEILVQVKAIAHRLKSSMFLVGINELEMNMATIEQHAQNPEERKLVERFLSRTHRICQLVIRKLKPAISI